MRLMKPTQSDLEQMQTVLRTAEQAHAGSLDLKARGLIPYLTDGDPQASLADAVRQMKAVIEHSTRYLERG